LARQDSRYRGALRSTISRLLPLELLRLLPTDGRTRWTDRLLALCAILMAWAEAGTLKDRFDAARRCLLRWYPGRRRPGASYEGFVAALRRRGGRLLRWIGQAHRGHARRLAEARGEWRVAGWLAFGVDSTKHDAPRTAANERSLGVAARTGSWPQMLLTTVFHLGSGLPWSFLRGRADRSERRHLLGLLCTLPSEALLLADAGFTGYEFWRRVVGSGRSFLVRVGGNVRLIEGVACAVAGAHVEPRADGIVWVWPARQRKRREPPLVLRLIALTNGRNRTMYLLTDVLCPARLDDAAAARLYGLRWGVEVMYRSLKQTMGRRKVLSGAPRHARLELSWAMVGLWTAALVKAERCGASVPATQGAAAVLRALRRSMAGDGDGFDLCRALGRVRADRYERTGEKRARRWPHKKRSKPPGRPRARNATAEELALAAELGTLSTAA
jgi:hypothetical protein